MVKITRVICIVLTIFPFLKLIIKKFFTLSSSLISYFNFKGKFKVQNNDNKKYFLYNNNYYLENNIYWRGIDEFEWELNARNIWIELSKKSNVIFDIGSNTGIYAVLSKVYNKSSEVYAFEPQPNIYEILKKNILINKFDIHSEKIAISNRTGSLPFYNYGDKTFSSVNTTAGSLNKNWRAHKRFHRSIMVPIISLKEYINEHKITNIDLMKIDVETHEYEVLLGMENYLKDFRPIIILEIINTDLGNKIHSLFNEINYQYYNIKEPGEIIKVNILGESDDLNYLLLPIEKKDIINNINL